MIKNNDDLRKAVNDAIKTSGYKKSFVAEQLGFTNQYLSKFLNKKSFSLNDANKILSIIGYKVTADIKEQSKND